jgi:hypothetical protein
MGRADSRAVLRSQRYEMYATLRRSVDHRYFRLSLRPRLTTSEEATSPACRSGSGRRGGRVVDMKVSYLTVGSDTTAGVLGKTTILRRASKLLLKSFAGGGFCGRYVSFNTRTAIDSRHLPSSCDLQIAQFLKDTKIKISRESGAVRLERSCGRKKRRATPVE